MNLHVVFNYLCATAELDKILFQMIKIANKPFCFQSNYAHNFEDKIFYLLRWVSKIVFEGFYFSEISYLSCFSYFKY